MANKAKVVKAHAHIRRVFIWISMFFPSSFLAVTALRPKHLVQRMLSRVPGSMSSENQETTTTMSSASLSQSEETESGIGGGAINEKKRHYTLSEGENYQNTTTASASTSSYKPSQHKSHLYHALEGLERYPKYLARWQEDDIDALEGALEEKLALVRKQREEISQDRTAANLLVQTLLSEHKEKERWKKLLQPPSSWDQVRDRLLDPKATRAIFQSKFFSNKRNKNGVPTVEAVLEGKTSVELEPQYLEAWLDMEFDGVYSFQILSQGFCQDLREFSQALAQLSDEREELRTQQLGKRPMNVDLVGLGWVNDLLFHLVMKPLAHELFFKTEELIKDLDWRHGFIAGYSAKPGVGKPRERLVTHTDDAECTLNICLGHEFEGGLLEFRGLRGTPDESHLIGTFQPQLGLGLIHAGRHFHDVTQVVQGDRFAFIMWARSWSGIRSVKCPCCWLNRRQQGTDCICGSRWN